MDKIIEKKGNTEDEKLALAQFLGIDVDEVEDGYTDHEYEADGEEYWVSDYDTAYDEAVKESEELFDELGLEAVTESTQEYFLENEEYCTYDWESDMHETHVGYAHDINYESNNEYGTRLIQECDDEVGLDDEDGGYVLTFVDDNGDTMYIYDKKSYGDDVNKAKRFLTESNAYDFDTSKIEEEFDEIDIIPEFEEDLVDVDNLAEMLADKIDDNYDSMSEWFDSIYGRNWAEEVKDILKNYLDYHAMAEYCVDVDGVENTLARYDGRENSEKVNGVEYYIYRTN